MNKTDAEQTAKDVRILLEDLQIKAVVRMVKRTQLWGANYQVVVEGQLSEEDRDRFWNRLPKATPHSFGVVIHEGTIPLTDQKEKYWGPAAGTIRIVPPRST